MRPIRVDGVTYEAVQDTDGRPLGGPRLKEPWWYQLVPHGTCDAPPLTVDGYWHERRQAQRRARWRRKGWIQVAT